MRANDDEEGIDAVASSRGHCVSPVCSTRSDVGIHGSSGVLNLAATLPRPFFPPFPAGENPLPPREEKGPLCPELRARNVPFPCTCRAEISPEELSNVAVISSSIRNGGNRVRNFPSVSIIIGDRIPSSSMNQERNRIGLKLKCLLRTPIILYTCLVAYKN